MRFYLISDNNDAHMGMRLSGIPGVVLHTREELIAEIGKVLSDPGIGILLVTEKLANLAKDHINGIKTDSKLPLIVEIPDRHSAGKKRNAINAYINEALGVKF